MKLLSLLLCAAVALPPGFAFGQSQRTIAVLDVKAVGKVDESQVAGLSALIASEVASRTDLQVLSGADLRAVIGFERQKQMLGCDDASCLAEIGGALGAQYIVASEASQVGKTWLLTLSLVDTAKVRSVARLTRRTSSDDDLVEAAIDGVDELMRSLRGEVAPAPAPAPEASVSTRPEPSGDGAAWVSIVTGVLATSAGAYFLADSFALSADYKDGTDSTPVLTFPRAEDIRQEGQLKGVLGWSGIGLGLLLVTVGIVSLGDDEPPAQAELPGPLVGGLRASRGAP